MKIVKNKTLKIDEKYHMNFEIDRGDAVHGVNDRWKDDEKFFVDWDMIIREFF